MTSFYAPKQPWRWWDRSVRDESVCVSTIAATAITAALIPMQSAHSRTTFRSRTTTCAGRRPVSREVQVQPTIEPTRHRGHPEVFATGVWTHESMPVCQRGIYRGQTHAMVYRMDVAMASVIKGQPQAVGRAKCSLRLRLSRIWDPTRCFWRCRQASAGPCGPGGGPYGRREHGRFRRTDGQYPRCGKGVN